MYSTTQASNIAALAGVLVLILGHFKVAIAEEDITTVLAAVWTVGSVIVNYWNRYKKGDLTFGGVRKSPNH